MVLGNSSALLYQINPCAIEVVSFLAKIKDEKEIFFKKRMKMNGITGAHLCSMFRALLAINYFNYTYFMETSAVC